MLDGDVVMEDAGVDVGDEVTALDAKLVTLLVWHDITDVVTGVVVVSVVMADEVTVVD